MAHPSQCLLGALIFIAGAVMASMITQFEQMKSSLYIPRADISKLADDPHAIQELYREGYNPANASRLLIQIRALQDQVRASETLGKKTGSAETQHATLLTRTRELETQHESFLKLERCTRQLEAVLQEQNRSNTNKAEPPIPTAASQQAVAQALNDALMPNKAGEQGGQTATRPVELNTAGDRSQLFVLIGDSLDRHMLEEQCRKLGAAMSTPPRMANCKKCLECASADGKVKFVNIMLFGTGM